MNVAIVEISLIALLGALVVPVLLVALTVAGLFPSFSLAMPVTGKVVHVGPLRRSRQIEGDLSHGFKLSLRRGGPEILGAFPSDRHVTLYWDGSVVANRAVDFFTETIRIAGEREADTYDGKWFTTNGLLTFSSKQGIGLIPETGLLRLEHGDYVTWGALDKSDHALDKVGVQVPSLNFRKILPRLARFIADTADNHPQLQDTVTVLEQLANKLGDATA
jgi:hypothetical protein